jgi:HSP20 family protein
MTFVRWNPWQEMNALQRQLDRLFEDTLVPAEILNSVRVPAAELKDTKEAIYLKVEIPGLEAKDLEIQVTEDTVSIAGERKEEAKTEETSSIRSEFRYGKFHRMISLPARVQNTQVTADYKDGILTLTLPKTESEKNKVVKVNLEPTV